MVTAPTYKSVLLEILHVAGFGGILHAQTADALIRKLVEKGIRYYASRGEQPDGLCG